MANKSKVLNACRKSLFDRIQSVRDGVFFNSEDVLTAPCQKKDTLGNGHRNTFADSDKNKL